MADATGPRSFGRILCLDCGVDVERTGYRQVRCPGCADAMAAFKFKVHSRRRSINSPTRPFVECPQCHRHFPDRRGAIRAVFCSQDCVRAWRKDNPRLGPLLPPPPQALVLGPCSFCERRPRVAGGKYCSDCARVGSGNMPNGCFINPLACLECGRLFIGRSPLAKYCSKAHAARAARRNRRPQRRAAKRGRRLLKIAGENFTTREIAVRDGWRCHLCGKKVQDRPYRRRDGDPTIDHLIPISDGGLHVRSNVALAHNRCNYERQAGGEVQLRLVG